MNMHTGPDDWRFVKFGLIVTGEGEQTSLPSFLRTLCKSGHGTFRCLRKIGQRSPRTSQKRQLKMVGRGKQIPGRDANEIGFPARDFLRQSKNHFVILIDDLERERVRQRPDVFDRYRKALDDIVGEHRWRTGVFFLVNMLEAYYFADTAAISAVLGSPSIPLEDCPGDVELIPHPKNQISQIFPSFDEIEHGREIVRQLDLEKVLCRRDTCASLRTLFAWCSLALMETFDNRFCLDSGIYCVTTGPQLANLRSICVSWPTSAG